MFQTPPPPAYYILRKFPTPRLFGTLEYQNGKYLQRLSCISLLFKP